MAKRPPPLPDPIKTIVVPDVFHPSSFLQLERCPLSVLGTLGGNVEGLLVSHPAAFVGMILHHVRHEILSGRWGEAGDCRRAALEIFDSAVEDVETTLRRNNVTARLVPLCVSVGRRRWKARTRDLERWADNVTTAGRNEPPNALTLARESAAITSGQPSYPVTGSEQILANADLRLAGRPDWFAHVDDRHIEVVDFKSGRITDTDGHLLEEHILQLQLYSLMLEAAFPQVRVVPFVERGERVAVPWGEQERVRLMSKLREVAGALPARASLKAEDIARPGMHCGTCRLRPRCLAYLETAPRWWPDRPRNPRPLPLDVWGYVLRAQMDEQSVTVRLVDASGRHVHVDGIHRSHGAAGLDEGDAVWFFDLEASEDLSQHGALIQPRNFHEHPPGPRWRPARRMRLFSGPRPQLSLQTNRTR